MKKISIKIVFILIVVFFLSTLIPRMIVRLLGEFPMRDVIVSNSFLVGVFLSVGIALLLFALSVHHLVVKRIGKLSEATKAVAQGNFDITMIEKGQDEISRLTQNFNIMVSELQSNAYLSKTFVRNFSHEFKTPITAIKGYADLIATGDLNADEIIEYSNIISLESMRLAQLSQHMLLLSSIDSSTIINKDDHYNVTEQVRSVIQLLQLSWEEKHLELVLDLEDIMVHSNKALTYQIWKNLIENAIRYASNNSQLVISLKQINGKNCFKITNYGTGIDASDQPHIYELFYVAKTTRNHTSSGVGLSIVKKIIDKLDGTIELSTDEKTYTTFTVLWT